MWNWLNQPIPLDWLFGVVLLIYPAFALGRIMKLRQRRLSISPSNWIKPLAVTALAAYAFIVPLL